MYEWLMENRDFPMLLSRLLASRSLDPEQMAQELVQLLKPLEWQYFLPYKLD